MEIWLIASAVLLVVGLLCGWMFRNNPAIKRQKEQFKASYQAGRQAYRDVQKSRFED